MDSEENKCTALIKYEPDYVEGEIVETKGWLARKREELRRALEAGEVRDPITGAIAAAFTIKALIGTAVATGLSLGASYLASRLASRRQATREVGRQTGQLTINSELGVLIPEIFGGDPGDGYGGTWLAPIVLSLDPIDKTQNISRQETGGGKGPGGRQTETVTEITYYFPYIALLWCRGPARLLRAKANADFIYDAYGEVSSYEGESASSYTAPYQINSYESASNGKEVTLQGSVGMTSAVQWNNVQSNGAATRQLEIHYRTGMGLSMPIEYTLNGGTPVAVTLPTTNENFGRYTVAVALNDGANTFKIQNKSATYNLGIDRIYCFPGHSTAAATTGVFDPTVAPDPNYDPALPFAPDVEYLTPRNRFRGILAVDSEGTQTGIVLHGGNAAIAIYEGNDSQQPDPVIEASINGQYGSDSTPAYRGRCYERNSNFYLTRWGGVLPNRTALIEHKSIKKFSQMCAHLCGRVNIALARYNFTGIDLALRGYRVIGNRYEPREPMNDCAQWFNTYFAEIDGVLYGKARGSVTVAAITEAALGWAESDEPDDSLTSFQITEPKESSLPKRFEVKYISLDRDGEPDVQSDVRQITNNEESAILNIPITATREEARAIAQRELYQAYVEKPVRFVASWEHLWWNVGDVVPAILDDGNTYEVELHKISGGIGSALLCEGVLIDSPIYTQPSTGAGGAFEYSPVAIPAMSILALLDIPLRDKDETENAGSGFYAAVTPRTNSSQAWTGASLYIDDVGWERIADFTLPATMGVIVSFANLSTDPTVLDTAGEIVVDLYHTSTFVPVLESFTEADLDKGANIFAFNTPLGEILTQAATVEQVSANRWKLTDLRHGIRGTEDLIEEYTVGHRAIAINEAVQFVPRPAEDVNEEFDYRAVTFGQSLDDAATVPFVWTGVSLRNNPVVSMVAYKEGSGLWGFEWQSGDPLELQKYTLKVLTLAGSETLPSGRTRSMSVIPGISNPVLFESNLSTTTITEGPYGSLLIETDNDSGNNILPNESEFEGYRSLVTLNEPGWWIEFDIDVSFDFSGGTILLADADDPIDDADFYFKLGIARYQVEDDPSRDWVVDMVIEETPTGTSPTAIYSTTNQDISTYRYRIQSSGSEVRFYRNYAGPGSQVTAISTIAPPSNLKIFGSGGVQNIVLGGLRNPYTTYGISQHEEDFTTLQSSLRVKVYQERADGITGIERDITF